jgi:molybdate transport system substrate-binding protein
VRDLSRFRRVSAWLATSVVISGAIVAGRPASAAAPDRVLIFAAASLQTAFDALAAPVARAIGVTMTMSYAASSTLARQIESGAPTDLFISADLDWMDQLAARHLIRDGTRVNLLGNSLVLIAPSGHAPKLTIAPGFALAAALGSSRLAVADPAGVPAGKYAQAALTSLGVWASVEKKLAPAEDVRAALRLVARGEAPLGIVYRTDAIADPSVTIVDTFPASTHLPIVYPIAITASAPEADAAAKVLAYLKSPAARAILAAQGFTDPVKR